MRLIYFDNAATSLPKPPGVSEAVAEAINTFGGAGRSGHRAALAAGRCVYDARLAVAELFHSSPEHTVFTSNATESLNIAISGLLKSDGHVITTVMEHNSVLRPLYRLREQGMGLSFVQADTCGRLDYDSFQTLLRPDTKAVVCTHASNVTGTVSDLGYISSFCRAHGLTFIVDAAQTAGTFDIDVESTGIDALCFTGHKSLMGPQGTGGLCVRKGLAITPFKVGGSGIHSYDEKHPNRMPEALEAGTYNAHGLAGLLAGIRYIKATGMDVIREKAIMNAKRFTQAVSQIKNVVIYGDTDTLNAPVVSVNIDGVDSAETAYLLDERYDICVRSGAHCAPLAHRALGTDKQGTVRFSFSSFHTQAEIDAGICAVEELARQLRGRA